ncbi:MAG: hypothetical protein HY902_19365 [Deltaproteobacteria bacterium]|nr:hypothetical protein [Deltaproteobacteria bacterium]
MLGLLRSVRWPLLAVAVVLTSLAIRATHEQRQAYARAVALEQAGDLWRAADEYRWALRWYTPWGPDHDRAAEALLQLGTQAAASDPELAVQALDNLRSGLIAGRSLWQPRRDLVERCSQTLPGLLVQVAQRRGDRRDPAKLLGQFTADYRRPIGVGSGVSLAVALGFLVWLGGLVGTARRGWNADGRWQRAGWPWLTAAAAGFALWAGALYVG